MISAPASHRMGNAMKSTTNVSEWAIILLETPLCTIPIESSSMTLITPA